MGFVDSGYCSFHDARDGQATTRTRRRLVYGASRVVECVEINVVGYEERGTGGRVVSESQIAGGTQHTTNVRKTAWIFGQYPRLSSRPRILPPRP